MHVTQYGQPDLKRPHTYYLLTHAHKINKGEVTEKRTAIVNSNEKPNAVYTKAHYL